MTTQTAQRRELKRKVSNLTNGIFETATDLVLFSLFSSLSSIGKSHTSRGIHQAADEAERILEQINYQTIKNTFNNLRRQGFLKSARRGILTGEITEAGLARISAKIPTYDTKRTWDRMLYLISYDIERQYNSYRNKLRDTLLAFGATRIHDSLYLTPYNPKGMLEAFVAENNSYGEILVSMLTEDSQIGETKNIKELIWDYFDLEVVNEDYRDFINKYKKAKPRQISRIQIALDFLSIVRHDPQLPFELLPSRYKGDTAYLLFQRLSRFQ